jgi:hypothetical protein
MNFDFGNYFANLSKSKKDILNIKSNQKYRNFINYDHRFVTNCSNNYRTSGNNRCIWSKTGNYFLKVTTDKGTSTTKFIKECCIKHIKNCFIISRRIFLLLFLYFSKLTFECEIIGCYLYFLSAFFSQKLMGGQIDFTLTVPISFAKITYNNKTISSD